MAELRAAQAPPKFHRDTQTVDTRNRLVSTVTTRATQMTRSDLYVSTVTDRVIVPFTTRSAYETSEMWLAKIVHAAVRIQCFFRVRKAIWVVRGLREQRDRLSGEEQVRERKRQERLAAERRRQLEAKLHPHTAKDFEALYHALQQWSTTEKARINAEFGEHAGWKKEGLRLAKLADLVDQETALIQKLDALKTNANRDNHDAWIRSLLDHMASPRKLKVPSMQRGKPDEEVNMDTPNIIRARELRDLYFALVRHEKCTVDERLQVLLHVKHTVKEYDCRLTRDVVDLIDREGDLISRGRGASMLDGLRRRIGNLFLQFVRTPEFNPEAAKYSRVPVSFTAKSLLKKHQGETTIIKHRASNELEPTHSDDTAEESSQAHGGATLPSVNSTTGSQMYACRSCNKYLPSTEFFLHTTLKHLGKCKTCIMDDNFANRRENELGLQKMVDWIRADELRKMQVLRNLWDKYGVALGAILGNGRVYGGQSVSVTAAGSRSIGREFARAIGGYGLSGDALDALLEHTQHDEQTALELAERICECALSAGETAFTALMTDHDIHYMLETIWKGRSAMPQLAEPQGALVVEGADELTFTRWDPFMPFSPWNSILLTKAEAATHDRHALTVALQQLVQCTKAFSAASANPGASTAKFFTVPSATHALYSEQFVANVRSRHLLAKQHFAQLATMERRYLDKLLAGSAGDTVLNSDPSTLDAALNVASKKTDAATVADGAIAATDV